VFDMANILILRAAQLMTIVMMAMALLGMPQAGAADAALLRVHGAGVASETSFDADSLASLGAIAITTKTQWTGDRDIHFVGVPLSKLLSTVGTTGATIRATALNDYRVSFGVADAIAKDALVAFEADGKRLSVREKGPFWIVFPWSTRPELATEVVSGMSIWQLTDLEIR
jgi:hypothetical protein